MQRRKPADSERVGPPLSDILTRIAGDDTRQRISIGDLLAALHDRAIGALILAFALPNIIPMPPALAICVFALALLERDGIWVLAGLCAATAAIAVS